MALTAVETSLAYITKANITLLLPYVFFYSQELKFNNTILHNIACTVTLFTWDPIVSQLQAPQDYTHSTKRFHIITVWRGSSQHLIIPLAL